MVGVAQLVERCVVVADAAGSSPVTHPSISLTKKAQMLPRIQIWGAFHRFSCAVAETPVLSAMQGGEEVNVTLCR